MCFYMRKQSFPSSADALARFITNRTIKYDEVIESNPGYLLNIFYLKIHYGIIKFFEEDGGYQDEF